jgi:hypothetical protein
MSDPQRRIVDLPPQVIGEIVKLCLGSDLASVAETCTSLNSEAQVNIQTRLNEFIKTYNSTVPNDTPSVKFVTAQFKLNEKKHQCSLYMEY